MINRTAFLISASLLFVMLAATAFRLALLPDWTHIPHYGPGGTPVSPRNSLFLLIMPACAVIVLVVTALREWLTKASREQSEPWKRWGSFLVITYCCFCLSFQLVVLARSMGIGLMLNPQDVGRAGIVLLAALLIIAGNRVPKLPWLESRIGFLGLDAARGAKLLRLRGRLLVLSSLAIVIVALAAPPSLAVLAIFFIVLVLWFVSIARRIQLRREFARERAASDS